MLVIIGTQWALLVVLGMVFSIVAGAGTSLNSLLMGLRGTTDRCSLPRPGALDASVRSAYCGDTDPRRQPGGHAWIHRRHAARRGHRSALRAEGKTRPEV